MIRKVLIYTLFFYCLALLQTSVLAGFELFGIINIILVSALLVNIFEKPKEYAGLYAAFSGGFFLDIFSSSFIGQNTAILLVLALFIKIVLRKYV